MMVKTPSGSYKVAYSTFDYDLPVPSALSPIENKARTLLANPAAKLLYRNGLGGKTNEELAAGGRCPTGL